MSLELIGMIGTLDQSETRASAGGPLVDREYVRRFARAHEDGGFDKVLVGYSSGSPDGLQVAAYASAHTERLTYLVAHRPGVVFPTVAARTFATLDQFNEGRTALHTITGGFEVEQRRDGDYLDKEQRYARTREYLQILKKAWTEEEPFDYDGEFYKLEGYSPEMKPFQQPRIPISFGGSSEAAYAVGAAEADTYAIFGQPLDQVVEEIARVKAEAEAAGRAEPPRIHVSFRPILGATDELAWERAHRILEKTTDRIKDGQGARGWRALKDAPPTGGSQRQLKAAERGELHGKALWTPLAMATGAPGNSTALVGSPETVAEALLEYVDAGVSTILIRGYDPLDDAIDYGRNLMPILRQEIAHRERTASPAVAA
jgi:alkanesulfonate monooxygenase